MDCLRDLILQAGSGLLIGLGVGAVVGFVTFALLEKFTSRPGLLIVPSGPLVVGLLGAVLIAIVGSVIGLITGVLDLRPAYAAGVGILLFALKKGHAVLSDRGSGKKIMDITDATLVFDFALIGLLAAVLLRYLSN